MINPSQTSGLYERLIEIGANIRNLDTVVGPMVRAQMHSDKKLVMGGYETLERTIENYHSRSIFNPERKLIRTHIGDLYETINELAIQYVLEQFHNGRDIAAMGEKKKSKLANEYIKKNPEKFPFAEEMKKAKKKVGRIKFFSLSCD